MFSWLECHKDFFTALAALVGVVGSILLGGKYLWDRDDARKQKERDLRQAAYAEYFSCLPLQFAEVSKLLKHLDYIPVQPIEFYRAVFKVHLLAGENTLKLILARNARFHIGWAKLWDLKRTVISEENFRTQLSSQKHPQGVYDASEKTRAAAWEALWESTRLFLVELNADYRVLLMCVRNEIGINTKIDEMIGALEEDQGLALGLFDKGLEDLRSFHCLRGAKYAAPIIKRSGM